MVGLLAVGAAAFGAYTWLTTTGPQPAEALPSDTLGYVSIDLDPSGSQKIAALKTLEKFPTAQRWLDDEGIGSSDDIRQVIFAKIQEEEDACEELDFDDDIRPWLGDRFAVAAIELGEGPAPVGVLQVKDGDAAQDKVERVIEACGGNPDDGGLAINGDWLIIAETDEIAEQVADDAASSSLSDDSDFQRWTEEAGDPGIVAMYLSPAAGRVLSDQLGGLGSLLQGTDVTDCWSGDLDDGCLAPEGLDQGLVPPQTTQALEDFGGLAVAVRFDDGSLEVEMAGDAEAAGLGSLTSSDSGAEVISTLPEDTAAALGVGFEAGWFGEILDYVEVTSGGEIDIDELLAQAEGELGLSLPEDAETLLGESAAIAVGSDFDPGTFFTSETGAGLPIGIKVKGDPEAIRGVLDKLKATAPTAEDAELFSTESDDDYIVIGPDTDYLSALLDDGGLGGTDTFQDVVREDDLTSIFFINFDVGNDWLARLAGEDAELTENLAPLAGLGIAGWQDDGVGHAVVRVTTD